MMARDFNTELRREDAQRQAEGIPDSVRRSIQARIEQSVAGRRGGPRRTRILVFAAAAAAIAAGLVLFTPQTPARLGGFEVARKSADLRTNVQSGLVEIEHGSATLRAPPSGVTLETIGAVALRREPAGVRVVRGRTNITVEQRAPGTPPVTILVSHGAIEVMGTAFTVVQGRSGGTVTLREGSIRFRAAPNILVNLRPGEQLAWPLLPSARPAAAPSAQPTPSASPTSSTPPASSASPTSSTPPASSASPTSSTPPASSAQSSVEPAPKPASAVSTEELLDRVESLRSRHQFEAAARELARGMASQPRPMRERLSFELGSLLTHQIRDARRACAHWDWHERTFRGGSYRNEVARSQRALGCIKEPSTP
jgi:transmembrane sensor